MNFPDYYAVLGLPRFYPTPEEIRDAFLNKVADLNASGPANPDARQELDSAYLTLSDAKKKREYDEVLDRYVRAEAFASQKSNAPDEVVFSVYDYKDNYTAKRTVSMSPLSRKIYNFLCQKACELTEISSRYPFTTESDREESYFFEISVLFLYNFFSVVHLEDYSTDDLMQFVRDGISFMSLHSPINDSEAKQKELMSHFLVLLDEFFRVRGLPNDEEIFNCLSTVYIFYTASGNDIMQKIENPDFYEAFLSMQREVKNFLENFSTQDSP